MFRLVFSFLLFVGCGLAAERRFSFNEDREGETPAGFRSAVSGKGNPGEWKIVFDDPPPELAPFSAKAPVTKRKVLAQLSKDRDETRSVMLVLEADSFHDFTVTTRLKIVSGELEQMAGIAFRIQDEKNYYYVRANAKDKNVAFFRYIEGELIGPISNPAQVRTNEWHQLSVECRGGKVRVLLDEREIIPWLEPSYVPFPDGTSKGVFTGGKVGFWTKADSVAYFSDVRIDYTPTERFAQQLVRESLQQNPRLVGLKIFGVRSNDPLPRIIASNDEKEIGQPGESIEKNCIEKGGTYYGKGKEVAVVTMPLHDRNGDMVGAVRVVMTTFFGQTEKNALARAVPIVKAIEARVGSAKELLE